MLRSRAILILAVVSVAVLPVAAEEILHFKSGSAMPVVSHTVKGDMVHVDLGDGALLAFPLANVDHIEAAGEHINLRQGSVPVSSVMRVVPSGPGSDDAGRGARAANSGRGNELKEEPQQYDPAIQIDSKGVAVYRPMANSAQVAKRDTGFAGNRRVRTGRGTGAYKGTRQVGTKMVIGNNGPRGRTDGAGATASPTIEFRPRGSSQPAAPQDHSGSSSSTRSTPTRSDSGSNSN
jgi:hypothetical protein